MSSGIARLIGEYGFHRLVLEGALVLIGDSGEGRLLLGGLSGLGSLLKRQVEQARVFQPLAGEQVLDAQELDAGENVGKAGRLGEFFSPLRRLKC